MTEIRVDLHAHDEEGHQTSQVIGQVVVTEDRMEIVVPVGLVFSMPLELFAWQMCLMEPRLGKYLVEPPRASADAGT